MSKNDVRSPVVSEESEKEDFPSKTLVEAVLRARGEKKRFILSDVFRETRQELSRIALNVTRSISLRANQPMPLSEGKFPTMMFATRLIQALHLKHGEDDVINLFVQEFRQLIADCDAPLCLRNGNELACEHDELILRPKQVQLQAVPNPWAVATA